MYKLKMLICILFLGSFNVNAQKAKINWGKVYKHKKNQTLYEIVGADKSGYFIVKDQVKMVVQRTYVYSIHKYSFNHEEIFNVAIPKKIDDKAVDIHSFHIIDDKFHFFYTHNDKKLDTKTLFVVIVDANGVFGKSIQLDQIKYSSRTDNGDFRLRVLESSKRILIIREEGTTKKGGEELRFSLKDYNFKAIWEANLELPYQSKDFNVKKYIVDEENNVCLVGSLNVGKDKRSYRVIVYNHKTKKVNDIPIEFDNVAKISDLNYRLFENKIQITGFYYNNKGGIQGIVRTDFDVKSLSVVLEKSIPFDNANLIKFSSEKDIEKEKGILSNYDIKQIIHAENGDLIIMAEEYNSISTSEANSYSSTGYYFFNIMAIRISKNGEIVWVQKIPKRQYSRDDGGIFSSYMSFFDSKQVYLIYINNPKNMVDKVKSGEKEQVVTYTTATNTNVLALTSLNQTNGEFTTETLISAKEMGKFRISMRDIVKLKENEYIIYSNFINSYKFGSLIFNFK